MEENQKVPFYKKTWFIIVMLIFIFPVGLILMWKYKDWTRMVKGVVTAATLLFALSVYTSDDDTEETADSSNEEVAAEESVESEEETEPTEEEALAEEESSEEDVGEPVEVEEENEVTEEEFTEGEVEESVEEEESSEEELGEKETQEDDQETTEEVSEDEESEKIEEENDVPEEIADLHLTDVRNDNTGEWKKSVTAANVNMPENAMHYYEEYMESGDTHIIVSFATNTTITLNDTGHILYVSSSEYQDGEEHDASKLGSGMELKSYAVDRSDGSIEEIE